MCAAVRSLAATLTHSLTHSLTHTLILRDVSALRCGGSVAAAVCVGARRGEKKKKGKENKEKEQEELIRNL